MKFSLGIVCVLSGLAVIHFSHRASFAATDDKANVQQTDVDSMLDKMIRKERIRDTIHTAYMLSSGNAVESVKYPTTDIQTRLNQAAAENLIPTDIYYVSKGGNITPISPFGSEITIHETNDSAIFETSVPSGTCSSLTLVMEKTNPDNVRADCHTSGDKPDTSILQITLPRKNTSLPKSR